MNEAASSAWLLLFGLFYVAVMLFWARVAARENGDYQTFFSAGHALSPWISVLVLAGASLGGGRILRRRGGHGRGDVGDGDERGDHGGRGCVAAQSGADRAAGRAAGVQAVRWHESRRSVRRAVRYSFATFATRPQHSPVAASRPVGPGAGGSEPLLEGGGASTGAGGSTTEVELLRVRILHEKCALVQVRLLRKMLFMLLVLFMG